MEWTRSFPWSGQVPELAGFIFGHTEPEDFLWSCKFMGLMLAVDTKMDESEYSDSPDKSCATVLGITLSLLWYECITTYVSRALVKAFHEDLVHAGIKTKNQLCMHIPVVDLDMLPLALAFRERRFGIEYVEVVPAEFLSRQANSIQDSLMGCVWEANNRKTGYQIRNFEDYVAIRRLSGAVLPYVICSDMLIARTLKFHHLPNSLFHGPVFQSLLQAINDIIGWHNDILSFHKEVILAEDGHILVKVVCEERNCASYTEAGEIALQLLHDRITEMERAYEQLKGVAPPEYFPTIDWYMALCRDSLVGTHLWRLISPRYDIAGTST